MGLGACSAGRHEDAGEGAVVIVEGPGVARSRASEAEPPPTRYERYVELASVLPGTRLTEPAAEARAAELCLGVPPEGPVDRMLLAGYCLEVGGPWPGERKGPGGPGR